jgi:hypothetical protein
MKIYLLYKADDMKKMTISEVHEVKNKLEGLLTKKPFYDLAVISGVLWRVAVVADTVEGRDKFKTRYKRETIPPNSQGFRGTALSSKGHTVSKELVYEVNDAG